MTTISNGESGLSVRTKLNEVINKIEGVTSIGNSIDVTGTITSDGLTTGGNIFFNSTSGALRFSTDAGVEKMVLRLAGDDFKIENGAGFERFRVTSGGNVGIGTSSPTSPLTVANSSNVLMALDSDSNRGVLRLYRANANAYVQLWHNGSSGDLSSSAGDLTFATNNTERMRIDSSGNVGIGTTAPQSDLEIQSKTNGTDAVISLTAAGTRRYQIKALTSVGALAFVDESLATERMRIDNSGNVGIGTSSPTNLLDVNADSIRVRTAQTPATAGATGNQGEIAWDADYIYVCVATNTWKRVAVATW